MNGSRRPRNTEWSPRICAVGAAFPSAVAIPLFVALSFTCSREPSVRERIAQTLKDARPTIGAPARAGYLGPASRERGAGSRIAAYKLAADAQAGAVSQTPGALADLGIATLLAGEASHLEDAVSMLSVAYAKDPANNDRALDLAAAQIEAAVKLDQMDLLPQALDLVSFVLETEPSRPEALFNRAMILQLLHLAAPLKRAREDVSRVVPGWSAPEEMPLDTSAPEDPYPALRDALLPAFLEAAAAGRIEPGELAQVRRSAAVIAVRAGDRFYADLVECVAARACVPRASGFKFARLIDRFLRPVGPLVTEAALERLITRYMAGDRVRLDAEFDRLSLEAERSQYLTQNARARWMASLTRSVNGAAHVRTLADLEQVVRLTRNGPVELRARAMLRMADEYSNIGAADRAWRVRSEGLALMPSPNDWRATKDIAYALSHEGRDHAAANLAELVAREAEDPILKNSGARLLARSLSAVGRHGNAQRALENARSTLAGGVSFASGEMAVARVLSATAIDPPDTVDIAEAEAYLHRTSDLGRRALLLRARATTRDKDSSSAPALLAEALDLVARQRRAGGLGESEHRLAKAIVKDGVSASMARGDLPAAIAMNESGRFAAAAGDPPSLASLCSPPPGRLVMYYLESWDQAWLALITNENEPTAVALGASPREIEVEVETVIRGHGLPANIASRSAARLSAVLLKPAVRAVLSAKEVVFVPSGPLWNLTVGALALDRAPIQATRPFSMAISLIHACAPEHQLEIGGALLVGSPLVPGRPRLPGVEAEIKDLTSIYPEGVVLEAADASRGRIGELLPSSAVVHFAGHAYSSSLQPGLAFIELPGQGDVPEFIRPADDVWQRLRPGAIVILSACRTGRAAMGLAYSPPPFVAALLSRGASAVVVSTSDVDDTAVRRGVVSFHRALRALGSPTRAAQRAAIENNGVPLPFQVFM